MSATCDSHAALARPIKCSVHVQVANNSLGIVEVRGETWEIAQAARHMIEGSLMVPEVGDIRRWPQSLLAVGSSDNICQQCVCEFKASRSVDVVTCSRGLIASGCC